MYRSRMITRVLWRQRNHIKLDYARHIIYTPIRIPPIREQNTLTVNDSYVKKFMKAVGWMDQSRARLKLTGYFLYESVPDRVEYMEWVNELNLPDTFASWFTITELHVWLLLVRYMAEDIIPSVEDKNKYVKGDGHFVRNCIIEALWADVGNRIKLLEGANPAIARKQVSELSEQFQAALVGYDEGISDDRILAAAVWRRFYSMSENANIEHIKVLDKIPSEDLKWKPEINWLSILKH
ncbi:hypothetical protein MSG28_002913 [Choristoneura fumiferana]|uniref:Uncharacterized protein n=1 Tax=Choristoneura fumiferana TaxID=7141 RepID=A0ACC0JK47_CHOFU|nr:hypothetical protein MSG28_002913 [Choristoneura fumiferana]